MVPSRRVPAAAASRAASTFCRIHWILAAEKYVAGGSPVLSRTVGPPPARSIARDDPVGPHVLPDDGVRVGQAREAVPNDGGLPLVGDTEGGEVRRRQAGLGQGGARDGAHPFQDFHGVVLDPSRAGAGAGRAPTGGGRRPCPRGRRRRTVCWSCPGRWLRRSLASGSSLLVPGTGQSTLGPGSTCGPRALALASPARCQLTT